MVEGAGPTRAAGAKSSIQRNWSCHRQLASLCGKNKFLHIDLENHMDIHVIIV
jgi:hypothetical protein